MTKKKVEAKLRVSFHFWHGITVQFSFD